MSSARAPLFLSIMLGLPLLGVAFTGAVSAVVDPFGLYRWLPVREGFNANKPRQQSHERMVRAADLTRLAPDAIILGTSRAQVGLDPDAPAWAGLATGVANAAFSDGTPWEALRYLTHAQAGAKLKLAIFGADYLSFVSDVRHSPDYLDDRLAVSKQGARQPLHRWADVPSALLSLDSLRISRLTVLEQAQPSYFTDRGLRQTFTMEKRIVEQGGARGAFRFSERDYADAYVCADPGRLAVHLDDFAALVEFARREQIRLVVMTSPSHVRSLELLRAAGLWPEFQRFKRELARITAAGGAELWEFGIADARTTAEEVPPKGDALARTRWYWESSHYRSELGQIALARVLGKAVPDGLHDWGVRVQAGSMQSVIEQVDTALDGWVRTHAEDVAELRQTVVDARAAKVCRRRQP